MPVGHGYNYFLACDTAERIIFAVVAGSGSGKLCWHSRGNDNDQENAGYVRESAGGSEQALRLRAGDGAFRAPARVTFFFCKKKVTKENHSNLRFKDPWRGAGFAAPAASRFPPDGEAASGGHISFCEERNVGKKVA